MFKIKVTSQFGRGIYADRDIYAGELIEACEILVLSKQDTAKVNDTDLKYYTFTYNANQDCLVLGNGEIFNHSEDANVSYALKPYKDRKKMIFIATRDIPEGEQLFINYSADVPSLNTSDYVDKNLI